MKLKYIAVCIVSLTCLQSMSGFEVPDRPFAEISDQEAADVFGGACDIKGGSVHICCEVKRTYTNVKIATGTLSGDATYFFTCDSSYPNCGSYAVKGCDTGVE